MEFDKLIETSKALIAVPYCCPELKAAGKAWLDAIGTDGEIAAARAFIDEAREDACTIDDAIGFFSSPHAAEHFGAEQAEAMLKEVMDKKANGEKYCGCEACSLAVRIFENEDVLLNR